jgi:hypothetical protein
MCRKSTDLSWEGDEASTAAAEENPTLSIEESAPEDQERPGGLWMTAPQ